MRLTPVDMAASIGRGLLSFPVTHFDASNRFDVANYRAHCAWLMEYDLAGLFAAGGTGEFFSLSPKEVVAVVAAAAGTPSEPREQEENLWGHPVDRLRYTTFSWQRVTLLERTHMRK